MTQSDKRARMLDFAERAARDRFQTIALRTERLTPALAAELLRALPGAPAFDAARIAAHVEHLPEGTGESVVIARSASQAWLSTSIPRSPRHAFEWVEELVAETGASSAKLNLGPGKATDVKVFWGTPEVNTLVALGGEDD
jgi:hypothetical protein